MGQTYVGEDPKPQRNVAVKVRRVREGGEGVVVCGWSGVRSVTDPRSLSCCLWLTLWSCKSL